MALATEKIADTFLDIVAATPLNCDWPLFAESDVEVVYGNESLKAVYPTDFTVAISPPDFDTFTVTPTAALLTKINDLIAADTEGVELNYVTVRRVVDYLTDVTEESARRVAFLSREIERIWMALQQGKERADRVLSLADKNIGGVAGITLTEPQANKVLAWDATASKLVNGPSIEDITDVAATAAAAAASAVDAAASASDAVSARDDILALDYAPLASPALTGNPTAPTPAVTDSDTSIATTAFAKVIRGYVNVKDHGALGDGATDDAAAITAAMAAGDAIYFPKGTYLCNTTLTPGTGRRLFTDTAATDIKMAAAMAAPLFDIRNSKIRFDGLGIVGDGTQTNTAIQLTTSAASMSEIFIDKMVARDVYRFLADENAAGIITSLYLDQVQVKQPRERGIWLRDAFAFIFFTRVAVDYVGIADASSNVPAVGIANNAGLDILSLECSGGTIAGMGNRWGLGLSNCQAVRIANLGADTMGGYGVRMDGCNGVELLSARASLCDQHGILINDSNNVVSASIYAGGRNGLGGTANQHGVYVIGTSTKIKLGGVLAVDNTGYGVVAAGVSSKFSDPTFANNGSGNYNLGGASDHLTAAQLASGALATATGPATG